MKKGLLIPVIAIILFTGCKPKSKSSLEIKNDSTKSNIGVKMPDIGDIKTNSNTTTSSNWSKEFRNKFVQDCISKASENVSAADAFSYCNCMTEKVEAKYPNENEVNAKVTNDDIASMRPGCLPNSNNSTNNNSNSSNNSTYNNTTTTANWTEADKREFMNNCTPGASKTLGTSGATDYCDCMMRKLMQEYPNSADVGNVSQTHMSALAADCLKK